MIIDENGLRTVVFSPILADTLGNTKGEEGARVLGEAIAHNRSKVYIRDWLYCIARSTSTHLHKKFITQTGQDVDDFIDTLEDGLCDDDDSFDLPPQKLTTECTDDSVTAAFELAADLAGKYQMDKIDDALLTLVLLDSADKELTHLLKLWIKEEPYEKFVKQLKRLLIRNVDTTIIDADGKLMKNEFKGSGKRVLKRLQEDAASLGIKRVTAKHLLYSLAGNDSSLLFRTMNDFGIDVKKDIHAVLSRELANRKVKRIETIELSRDTLMETVIKVLETAKEQAFIRGDEKIMEYHISLAFVLNQQRELKRLLSAIPGSDLALIQERMEEYEPETDDDDDASRQKLSAQEIETMIKQRIKGQDPAVTRVIPWVKRLNFGIPRDGRPAGVFLFLGPTGTGKTQLAKELARYVFGDEDLLLFMEMGQFKTKESMNMFIGAAPGYVGYGEGKLTNGLRDMPESVVLFDEIEKADTQVFDTLLRFADEGVISDPAGPVRDGRKCLIVMTTNAGQRWLREELRTNSEILERTDTLIEKMFDAAMKELSDKGFRPEFLGRVDERITFLPFSKNVCREIVDLVLTNEINKFKDLKNITIEADDSAKDLMAEFAHQRSMDEGARGAPRAVNEQIVTPAIDILSDLEAEGKSIDGIKLFATASGFERVELEVIE